MLTHPLILIGVLAVSALAGPADSRPLNEADESAARTFDADARRAKRRGKELTDSLNIRGKGAFAKLAALQAALDAEGEQRKAMLSDILEKDAAGDAACLHLGGALMDEGNYDGAVALYSEGLRRNPPMAETYLRRRADAHLAAGRREDALRDVDTALKGSPQSGSTYLLRSRILVSMGRLEEAAANYEAAWKFSPHVKTAEDAFICGRLAQAGRELDVCR